MLVQIMPIYSDVVCEITRSINAVVAVVFNSDDTLVSNQANADVLFGFLSRLNLCIKYMMYKHLSTEVIIRYLHTHTHTPRWYIHNTYVRPYTHYHRAFTSEGTGDGIKKISIRISSVVWQTAALQHYSTKRHF